MKKFTWRKLFNDVHLWLGIASGLVLFVVCLSGTIYTFREEVEQLMDPEKYTVEVPAATPAIAPNALVSQLERELKGQVTSINIPADEASTYTVSVAPAQTEPKPEGRGEHKEGRGGEGGGRPATYFVNPYTGQVVGTPESATSEFFTTVMKLHRWLLVEGEVGKIIVGIATIIFFFLVITGLIIWIPAKAKNWKQGLKIKTKANWKRVNHDLHNTLGFYSSLLLLVMAITGLCWSFGWYRDGLGKVLGAEVFKGRREKPMSVATASTPTLSVAAFIAKANEMLPYAGDLRVSLPADDTTAVVLYKSKAGFFALAASDKLQLNPYTAEALQVDRFSDKPFNEQVAALIKPLHVGNVFGTFSKILYFIACLIATSLPITGTLIWLNKLRKKSTKKPRRSTATQMAG